MDCPEVDNRSAGVIRLVWRLDPHDGPGREVIRMIPLPGTGSQGELCPR